MWGEDLQLFLPMAARPQLPGIEARPRLPGIGALPSPRQGIPIARKILRKRCGGERIASGVGFHPENPITGPAPKVRQQCCPRSIADKVFFHHSHALPSILAWAQDCPTQSWRGHRIAPLNPGVGDSPPGLRGKHRQCVGTHRCTPGLAARLPGFKFGKQRKGNGEDQAVSYDRIQQQTVLGPRGATGSARAFSSGRQNRAKPWL